MKLTYTFTDGETSKTISVEDEFHDVAWRFLRVLAEWCGIGGINRQDATQPKQDKLSGG